MIHKLEADSIWLEYNSRKILSDIYLKCETGKITGLLGRNGNGKTSLMDIIYGNLRPASRSVRIDDQHILHAYKRPDLLLYLPQFNFIPAALRLKRVFEDFRLDYSRFEQLFPEFTSKYNSKVNTLSGGQRRLLEIFVVLHSDTQFVLLDEPFSHLSPVVVEKVRELITEAKAEKGILVTDHLYRDIMDISDELYLLTNGKTRLIKDIEELGFLGYLNI